MARGRFINTSIATDVKLNGLSLEAHWLYMMTIPHLDRDGLILADTYVFFGKVCPRRPELISSIDDLMAEWVAAGLVIIYATPNGNVAYFKGFGKNQQGMHYSREGASELDPPPGYIRTKSGLTPDLILSESGSSPAEDQYQYKYQYEDQYQSRAHEESAGTAIDDDAPKEDELDPKALIADLRQRQFMYFDKDAMSIAARLISEYGWPRVMDAADKAACEHKKKISGGGKGIIAPLAYMRSVLAGGLAPSTRAQSMGEESVDKFMARMNGKGH